MIQFQMMDDYLFAKPSFLSGIARTLDLGATFDAYNISETPEEADYNAILTDWIAVGSDMRKAIEQYQSEQDTCDV